MHFPEIDSRVANRLYDSRRRVVWDAPGRRRAARDRAEKCRNQAAHKPHCSLGFSVFLRAHALAVRRRAARASVAPARHAIGGGGRGAQAHIRLLLPVRFAPATRRVRSPRARPEAGPWPARRRGGERKSGRSDTMSDTEKNILESAKCNLVGFAFGYTLVCCVVV